MLKLRVSKRKLTQGQPPAGMTLAIQRKRGSISTPSEQPTPAPPEAEAMPARIEIDPRDLARRVYNLMRRELALDHERRGRGKSMGR